MAATLLIVVFVAGALYTKAMKPNRSMGTAERDALFLSCPQDERNFLLRMHKKTESGCMLRPGFEDRYNNLRYQKTVIRAHRAALLWAQGAIPGPKQVARHKCRNKGCVALEHLEFGTYTENAQDRKRDGTVTGGNNLFGEAHSQAKIDAKKARRIFQEYCSSEATIYALGSKYGISASAVLKILKKKTWVSATAGQEIPASKLKLLKIRRGAGHHKAKLNATLVRELRQLASNGTKQCALAKMFKLGESTVSQALRRKTWAHVV